MEKLHETILDVDGMTCPSCVRHVDHALKELEGVEQVEVRLREGHVRVQHNETDAPVQDLISALGEAGYVARRRP